VGSWKCPVPIAQTPEQNKGQTLIQKRGKQKAKQAKANHSNKYEHGQAEIDKPVSGGSARPEIRLGKSTSTEWLN
jgi:hypothetical protein